MLEQARQRLVESHGTHERIRFVQADLLNWTSLQGSFDLIATNFFLDCFTPEEMETVIKELSALANVKCTWFISDFHIPASGWSRQRARLVHWTMYRFFRSVTTISAKSLCVPDACLERNGFVKRAERITEWGLLRSSIWSREQTG